MKARMIFMVVALAVLGSGTSASAAIHASSFKAGKASCGVLIGERAMGCFSTVLPETVLDGFIELGPHGRSQLSERGDCPFRNCRTLKKLHLGQSWKRVGVKCHRGHGLRCENKDGHGFVLRTHSYRRF